TFTVIAVDPDAITPQDRAIAAARHFVGADFKVDSSGALTNFTPALSEWFPPGPMIGSPHRYTVLLYDQSDGFEDRARAYIDNTTDILNFNLTDFAASTGLTTPVAATMFMTGPD
ncbi:phosphatidylethanolamine-binding protein, partial [Vararia minispora EC-137]